MKKLLKLLFGTALVSVAVALTYYYFEHFVHVALDFLWEGRFDSHSERLLVVPLCMVLGLVFFGLQHHLDTKTEKHEDEGLGHVPAPTVANFGKVLLIGFASLVAGASLGPEAILVPACILIGLYIGGKLYGKDKHPTHLLAVAGFIALLTAFFHAFIVGVLSLLLIGKEFKMKLTPLMVVIGVIASAVVVIVLDWFKASPYSKLPPTDWSLTGKGLAVLVLLAVGGYGITYLLNFSHDVFKKIQAKVVEKQWWVHGLIASIGLSVLYLLGGPLVEFTGNKSIVPMLEQSVSLGVWGLLWIMIVKIMAISWSKALGYRGGLIFPSIFVASALVAIAQLMVKDISFIPGLLAAMFGVLLANAKLKILL